MAGAFEIVMQERKALVDKIIGMMKQGATISMEAWNSAVKPNLDWNHAWGAVPLNVISRFVLGVTPLEPGFAKVRIAPRPAGLKKVSARIPTMKGTIRLTIAGDELSVDSPVPAEIDWPKNVKFN